MREFCKLYNLSIIQKFMEWNKNGKNKNFLKNSSCDSATQTNNLYLKPAEVTYNTLLKLSKLKNYFD